MEYLQGIEEAWKAFQDYEYAAEAMMICGALLTLVAALKIIRKGLSLAFWVILASLGVLSVSYGMTGSGIDLPGTRVQSFSELVGPGRAVSIDVLKTLCGRLSDTPESVN